MKLRRRALLFFLAAAFGAFAQPKVKSFVIVMIGPTGSGKTTQVEFLKRRYGMPVISIDDLIKENPAALAKYRTPGIDPGSPQSSDALNDLVKDRIRKRYAKKGFVLDGYPATKDQADHLAAIVKELHLPDPIVIQIDIPDKVARERLKKRGHPDDQPDQIERRLKDYHRELDMLRAYYPREDIWTIDGTRSISEVSKTIAAILADEAPRKR
jgi:adenylate kinase